MIHMPYFLRFAKNNLHLELGVRGGFPLLTELPRARIPGISYPGSCV